MLPELYWRTAGATRAVSLRDARSSGAPGAVAALCVVENPDGGAPETIDAVLIDRDQLAAVHGWAGAMLEHTPPQPAPVPDVHTGATAEQVWWACQNAGLSTEQADAVRGMVEQGRTSAAS